MKTGEGKKIRKNKQDPCGPCLKKGRKNMKKSNQSIASTLFKMFQRVSFVLCSFDDVSIPREREEIMLPA